jgi:bromodomain-containing protein 8
MPRSTRGNSFDATSLSSTEKLLFAQAVHELGADAWTQVSKLMSNHPLVGRPKNYFTTQVSRLPHGCQSHKHLINGIDSHAW